MNHKTEAINDILNGLESRKNSIYSDINEILEYDEHINKKFLLNKFKKLAKVEFLISTIKKNYQPENRR